MSITKGLENKIRRTLERIDSRQGMVVNWRGESYRLSFDPEQTGRVAVYLHDDEEKLYV